MAKYTGIVEGIVYRNPQNGFTVASIREEDMGKTSAVGTMPFIEPGQKVILEGETVMHAEYGRQIRVTSCTSTMPDDANAQEMYLASGVIRGIGEKTARQLVERFGAETFDVLGSNPERLLALKGFGKKRVAMIAESFREQNGSRMTMLYLQSLGVTPALAAKIYAHYKEMTETILKKNPYRLVRDVEGVGFRTADSIARSVGFSAESPMRLESGVEYVLSEAVNRAGHSYLPHDELIRTAAPMLSASEGQLERVLSEMLLHDALIEVSIDDKPCVFLPSLFRAEQETAELLLKIRKKVSKQRKPSRDELLGKIAVFEEKNGIELGTEQREAVIAALTEGVSILTGGPGTGKTTTIKCIMSLFGKENALALCAPTGRAAKRMSEATGREARTIHRLLEYQGGSFLRDGETPLEAQFIIVDETSMVDIFLMRSLLTAVKPGARLLFVGDADQLPSVGAGNVLGDMIASGVLRTVRLTEIFRQAQESMIVVNAHRINRGEYPLLREKDRDFFYEHQHRPDQALASVIALVKTRLPKYLGLKDGRGIQVMVPKKKGELGVYALNAALQEALNPGRKEAPELTRGDTVFRYGDRVMQIQNDYEREWTQDDVEGTGVFNGDIGTITDVDPDDHMLSVTYEDGRVAVYAAGELNELELAYCMSVHKSQGSEFEAVVLPLIGGPPMLMTRNLLYTAVTRARRLVIIVGREESVMRMVDNNRITLRYSALSERLQGRL